MFHYHRLPHYEYHRWRCRLRCEISRVLWKQTYVQYTIFSVASRQTSRRFRHGMPTWRARFLFTIAMQATWATGRHQKSFPTMEWFSSPGLYPKLSARRRVWTRRVLDALYVPKHHLLFLIRGICIFGCPDNPWSCHVAFTAAKTTHVRTYVCVDCGLYSRAYHATGVVKRQKHYKPSNGCYSMHAQRR